MPLEDFDINMEYLMQKKKKQVFHKIFVFTQCKSLNLRKNSEINSRLGYKKYSLIYCVRL